MIDTRTGEQQNPPSRRERFFQQDSYWYYTTREGVDIGPFDHKEDAVEGCADFLDFISTRDPSFSQTLRQYSHCA